MKIFKTPAEIRRQIALGKSRRTLYAAGVPPVRALLAMLAEVFLPSDDPRSPTTQVIQAGPGDLIRAEDIIDTASSLQEDTDTLGIWAKDFERDLEELFIERQRKRSTSERRLRQLIARASDISKFATEGIYNGSSSSSVKIDFSRLDLIDFDLTTVDILPSSGVRADGEAAIARDPSVSRALDVSKMEIVTVSTPPGTKVLSPVENLLSADNTEPYQVVIPGTGEGEVRIEFRLNKHSIPEEISGVEIEGLNESEVIVQTSPNGTRWDTVAEGALATMGRCVLRFKTHKAAYISVTVKDARITPGANGETVGLRMVRPFYARYITAGYLYTGNLLSSAAPLSGVKVSVDALTPEDSSLSMQVSFEGPEGPWGKVYNISSREKGNELYAWDTKVSTTEGPISSLSAPGDGSRFWELSPILNGVRVDGDIDTTTPFIRSVGELYVGHDQWFVETKKVSHSDLDYPYKIPSVSDWDEPKIDLFNGGVFMEADPTQALSGDVTDPDYLMPQYQLTKSCLFFNQHVYDAGDLDRSMAIVAHTGASGQALLLPGREYRFSTNIHCLEEVPVSLRAYSPGGNSTAGGICFTYAINGRSVLSMGEDQIEDATTYVAANANTSLSAGWNRIEIIVYRPNGPKETDPISPAILRISMDPAYEKARQSYGISLMRARRDSLARVSEFALRILRSPGSRSSWAWSEDGEDKIILSSSWGHDPLECAFDNNLTGNGARFYQSLKNGQASEDAEGNVKGCWVRAAFRCSGHIPPVIKSLLVEAQQ